MVYFIKVTIMIKHIKHALASSILSLLAYVNYQKNIFVI